MSKLPRNRLDDTLNAILIAVGVAAVMTLAIDTGRNDQALAEAPVTQVAAAPADPAPTPATNVVASVQTPAAR